MRHFMAQFGPALEWPWTKLMDVPEFTDELGGPDRGPVGRAVRVPLVQVKPAACASAMSGTTPIPMTSRSASSVSPLPSVSAALALPSEGTMCVIAWSNLNVTPCASCKA
jgi:hypothetical protein